MKTVKLTLLFFCLGILLAACKSGKVQEVQVRTELDANAEGKGQAIYLEFDTGKSHNHPSFVLWAESMDGEFIQTLFISKAVGTSVYDHGDPSSGKWEPGEVRRPASLPYWSHRRGIKAPDGLYIPSLENPVADAYTGATPEGDFGVTSRFDKPVSGKIRILFEINQTWDWNDYWTNYKYPDDEEYKSSCQPALVYLAEVDMEDIQTEYKLRVIGHSHYSGQDGRLYTDLSTLTTALQIVGSLSLKLI